MGVVYKGERISDKKPVAIKVLREDLLGKTEERVRFIREAIIYKKLIHPNLIRFYSFRFEKDLGFCLITELMEGIELEELLLNRTEPLPIDRALDLALQICAGLSAAHQAGIIHRDLKPGNIFLVSNPNGTERVKIFDFGIGKLMEHDESAPQDIEDGGALGTPLYMAPEQIRGVLDHMGPATDIYAVGVILFQLLTGRLPFTGDSAMSILAAHLRNEPPMLRKYQRYLAGTELERLVYRMMAKEPIDRPSSIEEIKESLWQARQTLAPDEDLGATRFDLPDIHQIKHYIAQRESESEKESSPKQRKQPPPTEPEARNPIAVLILREENSEREVGWLLPGETIQVGSSANSSVRLRNKGVRPEHASMFCSPQGWITINRIQNSIVRVNGAPIVSMVVREGDWITLGEAELKLHFFKP